MYLTDQFYVPGQERGVRFDDPRAASPGPCRRATSLSATDSGWIVP